MVFDTANALIELIEKKKFEIYSIPPRQKFCQFFAFSLYSKSKKTME